MQLTRLGLVHFIEQAECKDMSLNVIPRPYQGDEREGVLDKVLTVLGRQPTDRCEKKDNERWTVATCRAFGVYFGQTCRCGDPECKTCRKVELAVPSFTTPDATASSTTTKIPTEDDCGTDPSFTRTLRLSDPACK